MGLRFACPAREAPGEAQGTDRDRQESAVRKDSGISFCSAVSRDVYDDVFVENRGGDSAECHEASDCKGLGMPNAKLFVSNSPDAEGISIDVNSKAGIPFESEFFVGEMLFLQRPTPEPDHNHWPYAKHFSPTLRRWEMRCQGRFKKDPGEVFFGAEMPREVNLTWSKQMMANWVLKVAKVLAAAKGVWFDYSFKLVRLSDGDVIRPHYVSPMCAAEALSVTPAGDTPPAITEGLQWQPLKVKRQIQVNTEDTFTIGLWNKQLDFARWQIVNMPLNWTSSFTPFIGEQPVHFIAYGLSPNKDGLHTDSRKNIIMRLELSPCEFNSDWSCHQGTSRRQEASPTITRDRKSVV